MHYYTLYTLIFPAFYSREVAQSLKNGTGGWPQTKKETSI